MIGRDGHARNDLQKSLSNPRVTCKDSGWNGLCGLVGKNKRLAILCPIEEAKKVVNALELKSREDCR